MFVVQCKCYTTVLRLSAVNRTVLFGVVCVWSLLVVCISTIQCMRGSFLGLWVIGHVVCVKYYTRFFGGLQSLLLVYGMRVV